MFDLDNELLKCLKLSLQVISITNVNEKKLILQKPPEIRILQGVLDSILDNTLKNHRISNIFKGGDIYAN